MSKSRILDSAAWRFSAEVPRLAIVCSKRFWSAPSLERSVDTMVIALSMVSIAEFAASWEETSIPAPEPPAPPASAASAVPATPAKAVAPAPAT